MIIKSLFIYIFSLLTTSCQSFLSFPENHSYQEIFKFGNEVGETHNLKLVGYGGGTDKGMSTFNLTLTGKQKLNINEARVLFFEVTSSFVSRINTNERLRALTLDNTFSVANVELHIMLPDMQNYVTGITNGRVADRNQVQYVYFFTYNPAFKESDITYQEPYEQLKSIVEQQSGL